MQSQPILSIVTETGVLCKLKLSYDDGHKVKKGFPQGEESNSFRFFFQENFMFVLFFFFSGE